MRQHPIFRWFFSILAIALPSILCSSDLISWVPELGNPVSELYTSDDYGSDRIIWNILESNDKRIVLGQDQLVVWDGANWLRLNDQDALMVTRGLDFDENGNLWVAAYNEIGFFPKNGTGWGSYKSIREILQKGDDQFGEAWDLRWHQEYLWVVAANRLFRIRGSDYEVWDFPANRRIRVFFLQNEILLYWPGSGLFRFEDGNTRQVVPELGEQDLFILKVEESEVGDWRIFCKDQLLIWDSVKSVLRERIQLPNLSEQIVSAALTLRNGNFVVGTLSSGVYLYDNKGVLITVFDESSGALPEDVIVALEEDTQGGVWISQPSAVVRLDMSVPYGLIGLSLAAESSGRIRSMKRTRGSWYLAGDFGVVNMHIESQKLLADKTTVATTPAAAVSIWSDGIIYNIGSRLIIHDGFAVVQELGLSNDILRIEPLHSFPDHFWVLQVDQLQILSRKDDGMWTISPGIHLVGSELLEDGNGRLWVKGWGTPLTEIVLGRDLRPAIHRVHLQVSNFKLDTVPYSIVIISGRVYVIFKSGYAYLDEAEWVYHPFNTPLPVLPIQIKNNTNQPDGAWATILDSTSRLSKLIEFREEGTGDDIRLVWEFIPSLDLNAIGEIEGIIPEDSLYPYITLYGTRGILNLQPHKEGVLREPEKPLLYPPDLSSAEFDYDYTSLRFRFGSPTYTPHRQIQYQTRLIGSRDEWSEPGMQVELDPGRLFEGRYRMEVRAVDSNGMVSEVSGFSFRVLPPWFRTYWAYAAYGVLFLTAIVLLIRWRERNLLLRQQELESEVQLRTLELERASRFKSDFIANMSHEIRNPLNGVIGLIGRLKAGQPVPEKHREALNRAARYLHTTVEEILDFSKIESGEIHIDPQPADPKTILADVLQIYSEKAAGKGLQLTFTHRVQSNGKSVLIDVARFQQVAGNLIGNAIKFTDHGGVHVRLGVDSTGESEGLLRLVVQDTGPGIPESDQSAVFEKYFQSSSTKDKHRVGTGLGLSLCRSFTEALGGHITLRSQLGQGTTFTVLIPIQLVDVVTVENDGEMRQLNGARVLVVEDLEFNRIYLDDFLKGLGCEVVLCENGLDAVEMAKQGAWRLILLDWDLPGISGVEVARQLRQNNWIDRDVPIICMTAYATQEMKEVCLESGMDGFLPKPIRPEALYQFLLSGPEREPATTAITARSDEAASVVSLPHTPVKQLFNLEILQRLASGDPENLRQRLTHYLKLAADFEAEIHVVLNEKRDCAEIRRIAHALLGHWSMIDARELTNVLHDMQTAAISDSIEDCATEWQRYQEVVAAVRKELESFLE